MTWLGEILRFTQDDTVLSLDHMSLVGRSAFIGRGLTDGMQIFAPV